MTTNSDQGKDRKLAALARLYEMAGMHDQPIDIGLADDEFFIPNDRKAVALMLAAVTMHHHQLDAEVRDLIVDAFGISPTFEVIETACEGVYDAFRDHDVAVEVLELTVEQKAWVRGLILQSPVIQSLIESEAVPPGSSALLDTVPWAEWEDEDEETLGLIADAMDIYHEGEIRTLYRACGFTDEHQVIADDDLKRMGKHLVGRLSSLFRLIQEKHPHVPLERTSFGDKNIRRWLKHNTKKLDAFSDYDQQLALVAFLQKSGLGAMDPSCGGIVLTGKAIAAMTDPKQLVQAVLSAIPLAYDHTDRPIAMLDALVAYLGPSRAEWALLVPAAEIADMIHEYSHRPHSLTAMQAYSRNYMVRQFLGIQKSVPFTMEYEQLNAVGELIYKYGIAQAMMPALSFADPY